MKSLLLSRSCLLSLAIAVGAKSASTSNQFKTSRNTQRVCEDIQYFRFTIANSQPVPCSWILENKDPSLVEKRRGRWCDTNDQLVFDNCPQSCGECGCKDDKYFKFKIANGTEVGCSWIDENGIKPNQRENRLAKWCDATKNKVVNYCAASCGKCECKDDEDYRWEVYDKSMQGCSWILEEEETFRDEKRLARWCNATKSDNKLTQCPKTCGVCTSSPTPRPSPSLRDGNDLLSPTPTQTKSESPSQSDVPTQKPVAKTKNPTMSPSVVQTTSNPTQSPSIVQQISSNPTQSPSIVQQISSNPTMSSIAKTNTPSQTPTTKSPKAKKTSKPSTSPNPSKVPSDIPTNSPTVSISPTKSPKKTRSPSTLKKKCKKPKHTKTKTIDIEFTADNETEKDDINYYLCAEESRRKLGANRQLSDAEEVIVSAMVHKLRKKDEEDCDTSSQCEFVADTKVYYKKDADVEDIDSKFEDWLDQLYSGNYIFTIVKNEEKSKSDPSIDASKLDEIEIVSDSNTGAAVGVSVAFAAVVFVGLAFLIHRRVRNNHEDFSEVQTRSEGELRSINSNDTGRSWRNVFDASNREKTKIAAKQTENQPIVFPVKSNSFDTEYEVTK